MNKNIKIQTGAGDMFSRVADKAQAVASNKNRNAEFDFNGVKCVVSANTNLDWLYRDYSNSWAMGWKEVGPVCVETYDADTDKRLKDYAVEQDAKEAKRKAEQDAKDATEKADFDLRTAGLKLELSDAEGWAKGRENNTDAYGSCIYDYAHDWGLLMQSEINSGASVADAAEKTEFGLGRYGITGFMHSAALSCLIHAWRYGNELKAWHEAKRAKYGRA